MEVIDLMNLFTSKWSPDFSFSVNQIVFFSSLFIVALYNQSFWRAFSSVVNVFDAGNLLFVFSVASLLVALLYFILSLICFKKSVKPVISLFFIVSAITSYYMDSYGVIFDFSMIQNVFETDTREAFDLIDGSLVIYVLLYGVIPAALVWSLKIREQKSSREFIYRVSAVVSVIIVTGVSVYASYKDFTYVFRENRQVSFLINPIFPMRSAYRYGVKNLKSDPVFESVFHDARRNPVSKNARPKIFVMVVGETARASSFHINGYGKNTTPNIEKENILNFSNVSSCGTATAISVPCMFSYLTHDNFDSDRAEHSSNLLDALNSSGVNVLWRDNNSGCKGVCDRVETESMVELHINGLCNEEGCFDEVLLHQLDEYVNKQEKDTYIVLHQQGSHGPAYYKRYPEAFAVFKPDCRTAAVQECSAEEVVNAYDNTILYTDYFLSKVISFLKNKSDSFDTAMLYVSDHGESLGENGVYLHGLPYFVAPESQTHIPLVLWMSDNFLAERNLDKNCLSNKSDQPYSHDNVLHSILGVMDVSTNVYDQKYDIFSSCRSSVLSLN